MMPIATPYVGYDKDVRGVHSLWERFNAGLIDPGERRNPYHQLLLGEWQRCTALGVDVAMTKGRRLNHEEFLRRRESEKLLLEASLPIVQEVGSFLKGVPGIMILTERTGTVLHISGDTKIQERAAAMSGIVEGSRWDEMTAGTNGMGTALAKGQPVHVYATEHFCEGWHSWSCAASPVFDADGQSVLGIIDFTTVDIDFRDQALGLTVSVANSIQTRISLQRELERRRLLMAFNDATRGYPHDDMLALDHAGRPVMHTPNERCRRLVDRWLVDGRQELRNAQNTTNVMAPGGATIGSIVWLAKPAGYDKVFRGERSPRTLPVTTEVSRFGAFTTQDPETKRMLDDMQRIAVADVNLLIIGETGTGKELLARHVHACSPRRNAPYLAINCGAISEHLMESTFFGYDRGAFSGADPRGRAGYFESCGAGTLFLDEVGELPLPMQAALLRVLEDGSFQRVGSCETRKATCRIIAATHRDLEKLCAEGVFRQDLYYRLKVIQRTIKPLRERAGDIRLLVEQFAEAMREKHQLASVRITPDAHAALNRYQWPGNAREIRNAIEAAVLCADGVIDLNCLPPEILAGEVPGTALPTAGQPVPSSESLSSVREYERQLIIGMLRKYRKVNQVAQMLGLSRSTLYRKFTELDINQSIFTGNAGGADRE